MGATAYKNKFEALITFYELIDYDYDYDYFAGNDFVSNVNIFVI